MVEEFKKILDNILTKVCSTNYNDWDMKIMAILPTYIMTFKILTCLTPFKLVYGQEVMMPMEYIVPSICIVAVIGMSDEGEIEEILAQLLQLEED